MTINDRIKAIRKDQRKTQAEFASLLFVSSDAISLIERGVNNPGPRTIEQICHVFNVNRDWLMTGKGEMYNLELDEETEMFARLSLKTNVSAKALRLAIKWYLTLDEKTLEVLDELIEAELKKDLSD